MIYFVESESQLLFAQNHFSIETFQNHIGNSPIKFLCVIKKPHDLTPFKILRVPRHTNIVQFLHGFIINFHNSFIH